MRAVVISAPGGVEVLELRDVARPTPSHAQVLVRVHAAALNRADILQRQGRYPAPADSPADIPGMELAGEVAEIGPGVSRWKVGQRVFGIVGGGAYAEYLVTHERLLAEIPDSLSYTEAAAVPEAFITAHDALVTQAQLRASETVLIHARGERRRPRGGAADACARRHPVRHGAREGKDRARRRSTDSRMAGPPPKSLGELAEHARRWSGGRGMNIVLDLVGGAYFPASIDAMAPLGRLMIIGTMAGRDAHDSAGPRALLSAHDPRNDAAGPRDRGEDRRDARVRGRRWCRCSRAVSCAPWSTASFRSRTCAPHTRGWSRTSPIGKSYCASRERRPHCDRRWRGARWRRARRRCSRTIAGRARDHFDGNHFFNEEPFEEQQPSELARWQLDRHRGAGRTAPPSRSRRRRSEWAAGAARHDGESRDGAAADGFAQHSHGSGVVGEGRARGRSSG